MSEVTHILQRVSNGDKLASQELLPIIYDELRKLARSKMSHERADHTLQTTALVHEAYLRLVDQPLPQRWDGAGHFYSAAAEAMRRILVEYARRKLGKQRGGDRRREELHDVFEAKVEKPELTLQVSEAIDQLANEDAQAAELVKLHCFGGLSINEAAKILDIPTSSAYSHWSYAKAKIGQLLDGRDFKG